YDPHPTQIYPLSLHDALPILLLGARLLMGATEGAVMPISHSLVAEEVSPEHRGLAMGVAQNLGSNLLGSALAPVVLTALAMLVRSEEHTSELQSRSDLVCRLL